MTQRACLQGAPQAASGRAAAAPFHAGLGVA
jgi:hypothetical protein